MITRQTVQGKSIPLDVSRSKSITLIYKTDKEKTKIHVDITSERKVLENVNS